jgi:pimeloyl-ACP methyl ester carboxylesterase
MKRIFGLAILMVMIATITSISGQAQVKNILLVHGAFADGSGWQGVYKILSAKGYNVTVVQNPNSSLEDDVAAVKRALDRQTGPCILVGHSYGGAIITEAGDDKRVVGLVYVAAFQPDAGESAYSLITTVPDLSGGGIGAPDKYGLLYFGKEKFHSGFCADLSAHLASFMYASQIPVSAKGFATPMTHAPWKTKPTWGIIGTDDKAINPILLHRLYTRSKTKTTEIKSSHVVYVSHPKEVSDVIDQAAKNSK